MTDFYCWRHENLARFATEANERIKFLQTEIEALKEDINAALEAYTRIENELSSFEAERRTQNSMG